MIDFLDRVFGYIFIFGLLISCQAQTAVSSSPTLSPSPIVPTEIPTRIPIVATQTAVFEQTAVSSSTPTYYVAESGDDDGDGSASSPWATISHAVKHVPDTALILVKPGRYHGQVVLTGQFPQGITIRAERAYQSRLYDNQTVVICYVCQGITLEGFDISHAGEGAERYVIQIQDLSDDQSGGRRVTLFNNIIHDSYNNDLLKVNNGATHINIIGNMFYNMGGPGLDSHIDANSASYVLIEENIFFNDFAGSFRENRNDTGSYVVIKDSNGEDDIYLGSQNITVRRNVFMNWEGDSNNAFLVVGEDNVPYFQAETVLIEYNLMLGNSPNIMRAAMHIRGSYDVLVQHNTVTGDLPTKAYAFRLSRAVQNRPNEAIVFYNNLWADPTGTMGTEGFLPEGLWAEIMPGTSINVTLENNVYWNGQTPIPVATTQLLNYTNDVTGVVMDPELPPLTTVIIPRWEVENGRFADNSLTIHDAFTRLMLYGQ